MEKDEIGMSKSSISSACKRGKPMSSVGEISANADEKHKIDTVFDCVIPYIHNGSDRNSFSLVCRKWYELDSITRRHVTVHLLYAPTPSRLLQRFPFLESLTLRGGPRLYPCKIIHITPWIQDIANSIICLKVVYLRSVIVTDSDLELLVRKCGKELRDLKIKACEGFSTDGLLHISKYCNNLRNLWVEECVVEDKDRKWFHDFALHNSCIESMNFPDTYLEFEVQDLALLAKNCSQSLMSVKIHFNCNLIDLREFFSFAVKLEDLGPINFAYESEKYAGFQFPPNLRGIEFHDMMESDFPIILPFADRLTELNLMHTSLNEDGHCFLLQKCPNLEVLHTRCLTDNVLQVICQFCKKLRKFIAKWGYMSNGSMGLMALAQGCSDLERLDIGVMDITNEAMDCIGAHLKNLRDLRINLHYKEGKITDQPLDNGVQALLIGCSKLETLGLCLRPGGLTDVGLGYIGKYSCNLRYLFLGFTGESDAGIVELSKGCPKLRKLKMRYCPFSFQTMASCVFNITPLRYVWVEDEVGRVIRKMNRPK